MLQYRTSTAEALAALSAAATRVARRLVLES